MTLLTRRIRNYFEIGDNVTNLKRTFIFLNKSCHDNENKRNLQYDLVVRKLRAYIYFHTAFLLKQKKKYLHKKKDGKTSFMVFYLKNVSINLT